MKSRRLILPHVADDLVPFGGKTTTSRPGCMEAVDHVKKLRDVKAFASTLYRLFHTVQLVGFPALFIHQSFHFIEQPIEGI
jgi:hypothetical protein